MNRQSVLFTMIRANTNPAIRLQPGQQRHPQHERLEEKQTFDEKTWRNPARECDRDQEHGQCREEQRRNEWRKYRCQYQRECGKEFGLGAETMHRTVEPTVVIEKVVAH